CRSSAVPESGMIWKLFAISLSVDLNADLALATIRSSSIDETLFAPTDFLAESELDIFCIICTYGANRSV
ncbi:MAG: hypothetical protein SWY16_08875, partial [Cyanobacteriota bacterium]|nr:hypothetical protein [Cyanobacteriota bacterium]